MFTKVVEKKEAPHTPGNQIIPTVLKPAQNKSSLAASSTHQQIFYLTLGGGDWPYDSQDSNVLWRYNIPNFLPNEKRRIIQVVSFGALLKNYQSVQFPNRLGLSMENATGFSSLHYSVQDNTWLTVPTNVISWSEVKSLNSHQGQSNLSSYNVLYASSDQYSWDIGSLNTITLKILDDQMNPIPGPFNNPVQVCIRILHVAQ